MYNLAYSRQQIIESLNHEPPEKSHLTISERSRTKRVNQIKKFDQIKGYQVSMRQLHNLAVTQNRLSQSPDSYLKGQRRQLSNMKFKIDVQTSRLKPAFGPITRVNYTSACTFTAFGKLVLQPNDGTLTYTP